MKASNSSFGFKLSEKRSDGSKKSIQKGQSEKKDELADEVDESTDDEYESKSYLIYKTQ
jgi:hypothetical protein